MQDSTIVNNTAGQPPLIQRLLVCLIVAALGLACVVLPTVIHPRGPLMPAPLFPLLRTAVERMNWEPIAALAVLGLLAGALSSLKPWAVALSSIAALPAAAFAEMFADKTSHNLIPFELVIYLVMSVPVLLTAMLGRWVRGLMGRSDAGLSAKSGRSP